MKIDTHQHYWHYRAEDFPWISDGMPALQHDCLPGDVEGALRLAGIDGVVAVQARSTPQETDFLLQMAAQHSQVLGVVGWIDLLSAEMEGSLERWCAHPALKGFRHILQDEPQVQDWVAAPGVQRGLAALQKRKLVYDVLVFDHQLASALALCARHADHWLVLDHVGKPALRDWARSNEVAYHWRRNLGQLAALPHVMCKLSGLVTEAHRAPGSALSHSDEKKIWACFDHALEVFGPQRLMYGSDWPVCQLISPYDAVHGLAQTWAHTTLSAAEQADFWSGNAIRCYGLNLPATPL